MNRTKFLVLAVLGLVITGFGAELLSAGCRGRARRQERRANRQADCQQCGVSASTQQSYVYPESVQDLGGKQAAAVEWEYEIQWQCTGNGCRPVRVPVRPKPVPDAKFVPSASVVPKSKETLPTPSVSPADYETPLVEFHPSPSGSTEQLLP